MNQVRIKSLSLLNFKGIRKLQINDLQKVTNIYGDNATGKTTVFDAFTWLLFGKDSADRTAFEIKTLDLCNQPIPKLDHEVSAILEINGEDVEVKRILREKWVTKRGSEVAEFSGNETLYYWNDVPVSAKEFSNKIAQVVDEKIFKIITNPLAFNSLKWQDRRTILIDMVGGVKDADIAAGNLQYEELLAKLSNKSLEEYQKQVSASVRKMKADLKMIPTRIDEVERGKPEALDFDKIRSEVSRNQKEVEAIDEQLRDVIKADEEVTAQRRDIRSRITESEDHITKIKRDTRAEARRQFEDSTIDITRFKSNLSKVDSQLKDARFDKEGITQKIAIKEHEVKTLTDQNEELKETWRKVSAEEFTMDESSCKCPTCKRDFEADDIDAKRKELENNFNTNKRQRLDTINLKGQNNTESIKRLREEITELTAREVKAESSINDLTNQYRTIQENINQAAQAEVESEESIYNRLIAENSEIKANELSIERLQEKYNNLKAADTSELEEKKRKHQAVVNEMQAKLRDEDQIKAADKRIEELQDEERKMAQAIASEEREQFVIDNFIKAKVETLEKRINEKFAMVSFKMFATQINGGEVETCETLINGVPFTDANTASQINAGIDIINTLTSYYKVSAPIFIDNRESVVRLEPSNSQIINLIVSEEDKQLRVENVKEYELQTA